ncbi:MAG: hypothetical protein JXB33_03725, partial [Clostridia bacterium]|nr:hypothetical protein [Clostridia bacterium]
GKGKKKITKPLIGLLVLVWLFPVIIGITEIIKVFYNGLEAFGQGDAIIVLGLLMASIVVFIFGIFYTLGSYYMASDVPSYLHMPLKPYEITSARFIMVLVYEYLTMCIFFLPVAIGFGIAASKGAGYYIMAVPVFILLPVLPLSLASIIIMFIMSFSKKALNKDRFTMVSSLIGMLVGVGINIGFQSLARSAENSADLQELLMSGEFSLAESLARYFPGILNASRALIDQNTIQLILFILIAAASFALFVLAARAMYFKGVLGISQQVSRRAFDAGKKSGFDSGTPVAAYLMKELRLVIRTPMYFMNLVMIDIMLPVMMIVPMFIAVGAEQIKMLRDLIVSSAPAGTLIAVSFAIFAFVSAMNGITATSISREGKQLYVMKYIPMDYKEQLDAKLLSGIVVSMTGMVLLLAGLAIMMEIPVATAMMMLLSGANAVIFTRISGMFIDSSNPRLNWDSEQKAVKQNMNLVFNMLAGLAVTGLAVVYIVFAGGSLLAGAAVFIIAMSVINVFFYKILQKRFPAMIMRIE